jgi:hypothetical protein
MFKSGSIESELMQEMEKKLLANDRESMSGFNKIAKAIDYLDAAAHIFENAGLSLESKDIMNVLKTLQK